MARKDSDYLSVDVPKSIVVELDKILKKEPRYGSRSSLIKLALNEWINMYKEASAPVNKKQVEEIINFIFNKKGKK